MKIHICIDLFSYTMVYNTHTYIRSFIYLDYVSCDRSRIKNKQNREKTEENETYWCKRPKENTQEIPNKLRVFTANRMSFKI